MRSSAAEDSQEIHILGIGGSTRPGSSSERALRIAGAAAREAGATVQIIAGRDLLFPIFDTESSDRDPMARAFVDAVRRADGLLISSPSYHGGISGLVKNALDYIEDLAPRHLGSETEPAYLDGRAVGVIAVASGWQATASTLQQLRQVAHALRGWPTPLGGAVNTEVTIVAEESPDPAIEQVRMVGRQVTEFALMRRAYLRSRG